MTTRVRQENGLSAPEKVFRHSSSDASRNSVVRMPANLSETAYQLFVNNSRCRHWHGRRLAVGSGGALLANSPPPDYGERPRWSLAQEATSPRVRGLIRSYPCKLCPTVAIARDPEQPTVSLATSPCSMRGRQPKLANFMCMSLLQRQNRLQQPASSAPRVTARNLPENRKPLFMPVARAHTCSWQATGVEPK